MKKTTLITDNAKLKTTIADIKKKGQSLDNLIQKAGVACVYQSIQNSNIDPMKNLIAAMPKGSRVKALIGWAIANGNMVNPETNGKVDDKTVKFERKIAKWNDKLIQAMDAKPWYEFKHNDDSIQDWDLDAKLASLLKQFDARMEDEKKAAKTTADAKKIAELRKLAA